MADEYRRPDKSARQKVKSSARGPVGSRKHDYSEHRHTHTNNKIKAQIRKHNCITTEGLNGYGRRKRNKVHLLVMVAERVWETKF